MPNMVPRASLPATDSTPSFTVTSYASHSSRGAVTMDMSPGRGVPPRTSARSAPVIFFTSFVRSCAARNT